MRDMFGPVAAAAVMALAPLAAQAADPNSPIGFYIQEASLSTDITGSIPPTSGAAGKPKTATDGGSIGKQIPSVSTACLKPELTRILRDASSHFGSEVVVTSGFRRGRHSYHGRCMAADIKIAGVSPSALARWLRAQPGVGGVGTYSHTSSVHVDVAPRTFSWHRGGRRKRYAAMDMAVA